MEAYHTHEEQRMTFEEAFENDPQARDEFHDYLDEMAEEHVHVAERLHDGDEDEIEEDDGQPSEYDEWQDYMGGDDWDFGEYDQLGQCDDLGY
jgi:hypothetical protein